MEAAGWQAARSVRAWGQVAVVAGVGGNGGDAMAAARHLHSWGRLHSIAIADPGRLAGSPLEQYLALVKLGVEIAAEPRLDGADAVLDGLFVTGLSRAPAGRAKAWIEAMDSGGVPLVAIDVPSGLESDTGATFGAAVRADATVCLVLPKRVLFQGEGPRLSGRLLVADIGIPAAAYRRLGWDEPPRLFDADDLVALDS